MKLLLYLVLAVLVCWLIARQRWKLPSPRPSRRPMASGRPPHEVLGVEPGADQEQIRRAYHRLMRGFHPDRVAGAAEEIRRLAELRSKEINAAYEALTRR